MDTDDPADVAVGNGLRLLYMDSCLTKHPLCRVPPPDWDNTEEVTEFNNRWHSVVLPMYEKKIKLDNAQRHATEEEECISKVADSLALNHTLEKTRMGILVETPEKIYSEVARQVKYDQRAKVAKRTHEKILDPDETASEVMHRHIRTMEFPAENTGVGLGEDFAGLEEEDRLLMQETEQAYEGETYDTVGESPSTAKRPRKATPKKFVTPEATATGGTKRKPGSKAGSTTSSIQPSGIMTRRANEEEEETEEEEAEDTEPACPPKECTTH